MPSMDVLPNFPFEVLQIERVNSIKYLGLIIDTKLNWSNHVNHIKSKLLPILYATYRARNFIPAKGLWQIYHAFFQYMNPIWSTTTSTKMNELQRIQNQMIKTINLKFLT